MVFNTGTLHLFPIEALTLIFSEVSRVLKSNSIFIFDFATDITKVTNDGSHVGKTKNEYTKNQAKGILSNILSTNEFSFQFHECSVSPEELTSSEGTYLFSCKYWLVVAYKSFGQ